MPLYIGADMNVKYTGAYDPEAATYLNTATVTFTLYSNAALTTVVTGPTTMSYVAASNGNYLGVMQSSATSGLTNGTTYYLKVVLTQGAYDDMRVLTLLAAYRRGDC